MGWVYILTIEGIAAGANGIARYCGPGPKPNYGGAAYLSGGLAEVPRGASSQWDIMRTQVSSGRFTVILRPYQSDGSAGDVNFQATRARPVTELRGDVNATVLQFPVRSESTVSGIIAGTVVYIERETLIVDSVIDGASPVFNVLSRGYAGSTAAAHGTGADCFLVPPAMTGRKATVYEVNTSTATSSSDETLILQAYISGEVGAGLHWPTFAAVSRFAQGRLNPEPEGVPAFMDWATREGDRVALRLPNTGPPRYHANGGYWYVPKLKAVWAAVATQASSPFSHYIWRSETEPIYVEGGEALELSSESYSAYQISWSNREGEYPPFIDEDGDTSEHPVDIALCILSTKGGPDGTPGANGDHDLGDEFAADAAMGIDIGDIDLSGALRLKAQMPDIRASEFWYGGEESESLDSVLERLLAPWGVAVGRTMSGTWRMMRLADVFPGSTSTALTTANLLRPEDWRQRTQGRALDSVVLHVDARPDGKGTPQTVTEISTRRYYSGGSRGVIVGDREVYRNSPYNSADLEEDSAAWTLISSRIRRLSDRVAFVEVEVGPSLFGALDIADGVTIHDPGIRSPITGDRLTASDTALKGVVTSVSPDYSRRTVRLTIAFTDTGNVCLVSPSATVVSWDSGADTATVEPSEWTASDDAGAFAAADVCVLLNADLTLKSDDGTNYQTSVVSTATEEIVFDGVFKDAGGVTVVPVAGNVFVFAHYDEADANATMRDYGYLGRDGAVPAEPVVGTAGDEVYTYGDF